MSEWLSAIGTVGFPICACIAIGVALYKFWQKWQASNEEREKALLNVISEQRLTLTQQSEMLAKIASTLESISDRLEHVEAAMRKEI